mmetsp:Transcript_17865/g.50634  ORF Transcript_17865/g.50634 Transcript_17865/m.50634 type:complete len:418 (+) Transcript_17865:257-1510(+)
MRHILVWSNHKLLGQSIIITNDGHAKDFKRMRLLKDGSASVHVLFPKLVEVFGMFRPVRAGVLVMDDMRIFIQDVDRAVQYGDALNEFVVRFVGIEECVPAPIDACEQQGRLEEWECEVRECECGAHRPRPDRNPHEEVHAAVNDLPDGRPSLLVGELDGRADVDVVQQESRNVCHPIEEVVTGLVGVGDDVVRAVAVPMMVDGMAVGKDRRQHPVEHPDPPVEDVSEYEIIVVRFRKESVEGMSLLVRQGVHVRKVHEERSDADEVVHERQRQRKPIAVRVVRARKEHGRDDDAVPDDAVHHVRIFAPFHELCIEGVRFGLQPRNELGEDETGQLLSRIDEPAIESSVDRFPDHAREHDEADGRPNDHQRDGATNEADPLGSVAEVQQRRVVAFDKHPGRLAVAFIRGNVIALCLR